MTDTEKDAELILKAQKGNKNAYGEIVKLYMKRAYFSALSIVGSHDDALDLSQEAFIRAYRSIKKFDTTKKFFTWYYKILRNLCLNFLRDKSNHTINFSNLIEDIENMSDNKLNPHQQIERNETRKAVWDALWKLQPEDREIIAAKDLLDTSYEEIADLMQIPVGTVMSRLYYARKRLKKHLEEKK
ncbi:MAG: sigma-70 family RNA polymerase sigma factor [Bacteroidota bacterium]|nr:sigma-70 family RNA polymerase sigma factor [Bacteroidota bacterium]